MLTAIGSIESVSPEYLIEAAEGIAIVYPAECELQSWVAPEVRVEGSVFLDCWRQLRRVFLDDLRTANSDESANQESHPI